MQRKKSFPPSLNHNYPRLRSRERLRFRNRRGSVVTVYGNNSNIATGKVFEVLGPLPIADVYFSNPGETES